MKRYLVFDRLRVVALMMILACHFTRSVNAGNANGVRIDLVLGAVGNFIFFVLSGWLLGLSWQNKGCCRLGRKWLWHRIVRLAVPLWLFLVPYFAYLHFTGMHIGVTKVLLNLFLLNWFARMPGTTPYWFITAIAAFYVLIVAVSNIKRLNEKRMHLLLIALTVTLIAQFVLAIAGIRQGYLLTLFVCGLAMFLYARQILDMVSALAKTRYGGIFVTGGGVMLIIIQWILFEKGLIETGTTHCYWITAPVAGMVILGMLSLPVTKFEGGVVGALSRISFEMYLVHSAMLNWTGAISTSVLCYGVYFLTGTIAIGQMLNWVATFVRGRLRW